MFSFVYRDKPFSVEFNADHSATVKCLTSSATKTLTHAEYVALRAGDHEVLCDNLIDVETQGAAK